MDWTGIAKTVGTTTVILGAAAYFLRGVFGQILSRDLERFKAEVSMRHDVEIEKLRTDLRITASEYETRFTRLHETRMRIIAELYARLVRAHEAFDEYLFMVQLGEDPDPAKGKEAVKRWREFMGYFSEKRIYFEEELCRDIEAAFGHYSNAQTLTGLPTEMPGSVELRTKAAVHFSGHFPPIRAKVEQRFRELMGVHKAASNGERTTDKQA